MASSFFALLDDISALMDDVATMSKVATQKTVGILGDDLAVNAEKASGFLTNRELPVLWKIGKGSLLNKLIILPFAFLLSALMPSVITLILILGGIYLAYEGVEKIIEFLFHSKEQKVSVIRSEMTQQEMIDEENSKVKSAILVDFILSIEIIIIALSTVTQSDLITRIAVVSLIALLATVGVYGIVALIVRMDDIGFKLLKSNRNKITNAIGITLVNALPFVIKTLNVVGTIALILVSGGIFTHNIEIIHQLTVPIPQLTGDFIIGFITGIIAFTIISIFNKWKTSFN
ncbi:MAG: DUF808 family protein [Bacteroidetes bacterium]|nr:DUF808 family protein [Bacteroidota bacterium]